MTDTGVGIAEEDREIIFEKFRQSSATVGDDNLTREYSGTGLGLSIVKELCKLLGGEISFESELGKGSTFMVRLPWTSAASGAAGGQPGSAIGRTDPHATPGTARRQLRTRHPVGPACRAGPPDRKSPIH